ncbi:MAG: phosphate signaling complex protein PhoU [Acidobacteria bacterium]|nr:phosphate signaling complex protein PhoU [Acidobacteriota bacterium]MCI0627422.1 phosphate signaling complex protein PhoU [Acidobacteriota bacterium]
MPSQFEQQLDELKNRMLFMGSLVERAIQLSIEALHERDEQPAKRVIAEIEPQVNHLHLELDDRALHLLALQQPMVVDLRFITATMKINSDLERIGDQAVNIAQRALSILSQPQLKPLVDIPLMAEMARKMVKDALDAFVRKNTDLARHVLLRDDEVDQYRDLVFHKLVPLMARNPECVQQALDLILVSRNLERIADHATNVAEDVIYMVLGRDIRHHAEEKVLANNE